MIPNTEEYLARVDIKAVEGLDQLIIETSEKFEPLLVQFTAEGRCPDCVELTDYLEKRFRDEKRVVNWATVDVDDDELDDLKERYMVVKLPTVLIFFRSDDPAWRAEGKELMNKRENILVAMRNSDAGRPVFTQDADF